MPFDISGSVDGQTGVVNTGVIVASNEMAYSAALPFRKDGQGNVERWGSQVVVVESATPTGGAQGEHATQYYIRPVDGTAIKNASGTLTVEARIVTGEADALLDSGDVKLTDGQVFSGTGTVYGDGYSATFAPSDIGSNLTVYLEDVTTGEIHDTITLAAVTDGLAAWITSDNGLGWRKAPNDGPWVHTDPITLTGHVFALGQYYTRTIQLTLDPNTGNITAGTPSAEDAEVLMNVLNDGTPDVTVEIAHQVNFPHPLIPDVTLEASETVFSVIGGAKGDPGTSVTILDELASTSDLPATGDPGDGYIIGGDLYVWLAESSSWQNVGQIQGPPGASSYIHVKWSNDGGSTFTQPDGETPGDWMGTYVDTNPTDSSDPADYTWVKVKGDPGEDGEDGVGIDWKGEYASLTALRNAHGTEQEGWAYHNTTDELAYIYRDGSWQTMMDVVNAVVANIVTLFSQDVEVSGTLAMGATGKITNAAGDYTLNNNGLSFQAGTGQARTLRWAGSEGSAVISAGPDGELRLSAPLTTNGVVVDANLRISEGLFVGGNEVWDAGNLDPADFSEHHYIGSDASPAAGLGATGHFAYNDGGEVWFKGAYGVWTKLN